MNDLIKKDADTPTPAVLVSVIFKGSDQESADISLNELELLLKTAGGEAFARIIQTKDAPDPKTYIGSGKAQELLELCKANDIKLVIFDTELSPSQIKNLEDALEDAEVRVIDRSMLILDIFALHASNGEGKLQVELAQLKYTVPRLIGKGTQLSRQHGGSIATRGPGETKLESDRRHVRRRITALQGELAEIERHRNVQRKQRERSGIFKVAVAGYTNAGKSTLLNRLTDAGILAEDKLFATLSPTTRKFTLPDGNDILLTDTVGFIRNLPHHLIESFKSTLDEVKYADLILIIIDASDPEYRSQTEVTQSILCDLECADTPTLYVYNKCDAAPHEPIAPPDIKREDVLYISALTGTGVDALVERISEISNEGSSEVELFIPSADMSRLSMLYEKATVKSTEYTDSGVSVTAICDKCTKGMFEKWIIKK